MGDDLADVGDKAHVKHSVGFIEDKGLNCGEVDVALIAEVHESAGRGDEDVDASSEVTDLRGLGDAAV